MCRASIQGPLGDELIEQLYGLARATTQTIFDTCVEKMRFDFPKCLDAIAYIVANARSFVAFYFIADHHRSFGQTTNNPVEQSWEFLKAVRNMPVITMFQTIRAHFCAKLLKQLEFATKHASGVGIYKGAGSRNNIVPVIMKKLEAAVGRLKKKDVVISTFVLDIAACRGTINTPTIFVSTACPSADPLSKC